MPLLGEHLGDLGFLVLVQLLVSLEILQFVFGRLLLLLNFIFLPVIELVELPVHLLLLLLLGLPEQFLEVLFWLPAGKGEIGSHIVFTNFHGGTGFEEVFEGGFGVGVGGGVRNDLD